MTDHLDDIERLLVQRRIASILDGRSVYMGGPSHRSMRLAGKIIEELELEGRLVPTRCDHSAWKSPLQHGIYCPACHTVLPGKEGAP